MTQPPTHGARGVPQHGSTDCLQITLRSGAVVKADVTEVTTKHDPVTGRLVEITWDKPGRHRLMHVNVDQVDAIVFVADEESDEVRA